MRGAGYPGSTYSSGYVSDGSTLNLGEMTPEQEEAAQLACIEKMDESTLNEKFENMLVIFSTNSFTSIQILTICKFPE